MRCSKCGFENNDSNKFCVGCGELLEEQVKEEKAFCSYCGAVLTEGSKYCESCGKKVIDDEVINNIPVANATANGQSLATYYNKTALILGIISLSVSIVCCCAVFVAQIASIILGIIAIVKALKYKNTANIVGLILGIIGICISLYFIASYALAFSDPTFWDTFWEAYEEGYNQGLNNGNNYTWIFFIK